MHMTHTHTHTHTHTEQRNTTLQPKAKSTHTHTHTHTHKKRRRKKKHTTLMLHSAPQSSLNSAIYGDSSVKIKYKKMHRVEGRGNGREVMFSGPWSNMIDQNSR